MGTHKYISISVYIDIGIYMYINIADLLLEVGAV